MLRAATAVREDGRWVGYECVPWGFGRFGEFLLTFIQLLRGDVAAKKASRPTGRHIPFY